jgi:magnesium transporter
MNLNASVAVEALNRHYFISYPREVAQKLETVSAAEAANILAAQPLVVFMPVWEFLSSDLAEAIFEQLPDEIARRLLSELEPALSTALLNRMEDEQKEHYLSRLDPYIAKELRAMLNYPPDSAGQLMDPKILNLRGDMTVDEAETRIRAQKPRSLRDLFLVDESGRLSGRIELQEFAIADSEQTLQALARPVITSVQDVAPREEVVEKLEQYKLSSIPVVNFDGRFIGVIRHNTLVTALQEEASVSIQTMVGVSKDERALSNVSFAVAKRLPWLQINLLTAFLAASVVGLFEDTIAKFTALAVLLPVVAGQSGNAGAQALAVTMRGLALREISLRHWPKVVFKEVNTGLLNGLAIAATTSIGVYLWSRSLGLALVISISMVLSMIAAGFSGAIIPITLRRLGQDPAQSSSIILTTVTDVTGFFSFLGIATLLSALL